MDKIDQALGHLHWLGHSSFRLDGPPIVYFDPWKVPANSPPADLILISHEHHDHCSPEDVGAVRQKSTVVVANPSAAKRLKGPVTVLRPGEQTTAAGVEIKAVPAYNIDKRYHVREAEHLGFVVNVAGVRFYHSGDTDHIPEMADIECDVALLPVSGTYVMTADEAAAAAEVISPRVAVPMHYGAGVAGTIADAQRFRDLVKGKVVIPLRTD